MIRKALAILVIMGVGISLTGQNFISENNQWNVRVSFFPLSISTDIFFIDGDSVVNSITYSKLYASYDSLETIKFEGLLREEANIVYYLPEDRDEGILYDFNLETGDTTYVNNFFCSDIEVIIMDVDSVEYFGEKRKRWNVGGCSYWIEGIGSTNGPIHTHYWECLICPDWELICFHESDSLKYIKEGEFSCYTTTVGIDNKNESEDILIVPNPVKSGNSVSLESKSKPEKVAIYNSSGVLVRQINPISEKTINVETGNLVPGLYIIKIYMENEQVNTCKMYVE